MKLHKILETDRLIIRELNINDAGFIKEIVNTEGWISNIGDRNIRTISDAENYIRSGPLKSYKENNFGMWLLEEKIHKLPVGMCGLIKRPGLKNIDIGYALLPEYYKKGYALESAKAVLDYGKNSLEIAKIVAICNMDNHDSIKLLNKLGLHIEKKMLIDTNKEVYLLS